MHPVMETCVIELMEAQDLTCEDTVPVVSQNQQRTNPKPKPSTKMKFTQSLAMFSIFGAKYAHARSPVVCPTVYEPVLCTKPGAMFKDTQSFPNKCEASNAGFLDSECICDEYDAITHLMDGIFGIYNCHHIEPRPAVPEDAEVLYTCQAGDTTATLVAKRRGLPAPYKLPYSLELETQSNNSNLGSALSMMSFVNACTDLSDAADFLQDLVPVTCPPVPQGAMVTLDHNPQECSHWVDPTLTCDYPNLSSAEAAGFFSHECNPVSSTCPTVPANAIITLDHNPQECIHWEDPTLICHYPNTSAAQASGFLAHECQSARPDCPIVPDHAVVNFDMNPQTCVHWEDSTVICEYPNTSSAEAAGFLLSECAPTLH